VATTAAFFAIFSEASNATVTTSASVDADNGRTNSPTELTASGTKKLACQSRVSCEHHYTANLRTQTGFEFLQMYPDAYAEFLVFEKTEALCFAREELLHRQTY